MLALTTSPAPPPSSVSNTSQRQRQATTTHDVPLRRLVTRSSSTVGEVHDGPRLHGPESRSPSRDPAKSPNTSTQEAPDDDPPDILSQPQREPTALDGLDPPTFAPGVMAPKPTPLMPRDRPGSVPYGSVSLQPNDAGSSNSTSSAANEQRDQSDAVTERTSVAVQTQKSDVSRLSSASTRAARRRKSLDLDTGILVSGLEGRFGVAETPIPKNAIDPESDDSDTSSKHAYETSDYGPHDGPPDDSPHAVVRASVSPTDNTTLSINTPRMWVLSALFAVLGSSTNLFFSLRYPSVAITPVIALLLVHPLGHGWDYLFKRDDDLEEEFIDGVLSPKSLDAYSWRNPKGWRLWLAQGRWNEKEHTCVYVSSNVSFGFAFATDVIVEQTRFYNQDASIVYQVLLTLSTQILGYSFAGITRSFLVRPSGMIWPGTLMSAAMFGTLHKEENQAANGWRLSRWGFFLIVFLASFAFYFLPGLLMPALSYFNVVTWFAPKNVVVANLFGVASGLGMFPLTFDWAQITYIGSPLLPPFWAAMNVVGGMVVVMWIAAPVAYYLNLYYSSYMPILSASVYDNTGHIYDVSKILNKDFVFDREAYSRYSRVFLPITYVFSYGMQFAALSALLTHTACWHGRDIWNTLKGTIGEAKNEYRRGYQPVSSFDNPPCSSDSSASWGNGEPSPRSGDAIGREDVHNRLMRRYKEAPISWYLLTFVSMLAVGIFIVEYYPVHLPWYGLLLALAICAVFFIPNGIIMAITNTHNSTYLICQLVSGVIFPGRPIANMLFVTYGYISSAQGIKFASDLKLGHYMKIPPRILFAVQMAATVISSVTQILVLNWMFTHVDGLCTPSAVNGFTCPIARVHFNGSILWGVVGPTEFFGRLGPYRALMWCFLAGAVLPIPLWLYSCAHPRSLVRKISLPVVFGAMSWIPPATGLNFSVWVLVSYIFNYRIRRCASEWWAKYTMTLSAALDSGLAFGIVVVFFGFIYPGWMKDFGWWGTEIHKQGCDWQACSYRTVPEGGHFGPDEW